MRDKKKGDKTESVVRKDVEKVGDLLQKNDEVEIPMKNLPSCEKADSRPTPTNIKYQRCLR